MVSIHRVPIAVILIISVVCFKFRFKSETFHSVPSPLLQMGQHLTGHTAPSFSFFICYINVCNAFVVLKTFIYTAPMIRSTEFDEFYNSLPANVQNKVKYAMNIIADVKVVNTKLVKKLVDTDFYELRISVGNEYRVILFTIDHENFIEAEQILLLNGFIKKSTKDYKKEIQKAEQILNSLQQ